MMNPEDVKPGSLIKITIIFPQGMVGSLLVCKEPGKEIVTMLLSEDEFMVLCVKETKALIKPCRTLYAQILGINKEFFGWIAVLINGTTQVSTWDSVSSLS
jgi:hypothetical protein